MTYAYVYLDKNKDYVYCFKRESILEEEECDYYDHNVECDKKNDFWGRTHRKGTLAGYKVRGISGKMMQSCKYCLKNHDHEKYYLPVDAAINQKGHFHDTWEMIKSFFK